MILEDEVAEFYKEHEIEFYQDFFQLKTPWGPWVEFTPYPYQRPAILARENLQAWLWPRRAGKTTTVAAKAVYNITIEAEKRLIVISPRQSQSDRIIRFVKDFINTSPYKDIFFEEKPLRWSTSEVMLSNHSSIVSLPEGEGAISALGEGGDLVIMDEVGVLKNARESIAAIQPIILDRKGTLLLISTSWGKRGKGRFWYEVCTGETYKLYECNIEDVMRDQKEILPPAVFKKKAALLEEMRRDMGDFLYNMQFMNSFEGGVDIVFDYDAVKKAASGKDSHKPINLISVDLGISQAHGDETVIALCHVSSGSLTVIRWIGLQKPYSVVQEMVKDFAERHNCNNVIVDGNTGTSVLEYLTKNGIEAQGIYFTNTKQTKRWREKGVRYISINKNKTVHRTAQLFVDRKIILPESGVKILNQFFDYSALVSDRGNIIYSHVEGGHDDYVDVVLFAVGFSVHNRDVSILR